MILRRSICTLCLLLCGAPAPVVNAAEKPNQEAKSLFEKAKKEAGDRSMQVQDFCSAAQMDPKNKQYADTCNNYRQGLM